MPADVPADITESEVDAGSPPRRRRLNRLAIFIRTVPVSWRVFLIVVLNGVATAALGLLIWGGGRVIVGEWDEVRRVQEYDRLFVAIDSDVSRLQSLVHRTLHAPTDDLLTEIGRRRETLLGKLERTVLPDAEMADDLARLTTASRRFLGSFDLLREQTTRMRAGYETAVLKVGGELSGLYAILDSQARNGNTLIQPPLGRAREAFADGLLAANAFYLSGDAAASARAERAFEAIARAIPVMHDLASEDIQRSALDAMAVRVETLRQGLAAVRVGLEQRVHLVGTEIDGGQRAMAQIIDRLVGRSRLREAEAKARFDAALLRVGWGIALVAALFLAFSAAISWAIGASIRRPLRGLMQAMTAIAGGDYARPIYGTTVPDEIGAMAKALAVFREEAAEKRRVEGERDAQERRWRTMLETSPVGISIVCALSHVRLYSNPKYDALFGMPEHGVALGLPVAVSFADPADMQRMTAAFGEQGYVSGLEVRRRRFDGSVWWCLLDIRPMEYDGRPAYIVWHYDVTYRRLAEEELRGEKERAEQALADLRQAQQSLIHAEKMASLGALVAGVAHEINTPVGVTVTAASLLADETAALLRLFEAGTMRRTAFERYAELAQEASERILSNANRAAELIQSFKQVAVDQTRDDRRRFDLAQYIHEVLVSLGPRLKQTGVQVSVDCPEGLEVDGYPGPLAQVLTNLVVNALVHAFEPSHYGHIRLHAGPSGDDGVVLVFADDGKGIAPDVLPKIFDPFFTTNRIGGGTGLGLNIVYNLVRQKLAGSIEVASVPAEGTSFTIRFPRRM